MRINGEPVELQPDASGYVEVAAEWVPGDRVQLGFDMPARVLADAMGNVGKVAFVRGPLVFAADVADLPPGRLLDDVVVALDPVSPATSVRTEVASDAGPVQLIVDLASIEPGLGEGSWIAAERYHDLIARGTVSTSGTLRLAPFFLAGSRAEDSFRDEIAYAKEPVTDVTFQVWLPYAFTDGERPRS
jgi:DUF1680 family protein